MKLNHKILGEGTPIVILHGLFGMLDNWMTFGKALAKDYKVILVDHRNHGKSPHADQIGYDLYANDLKELLDDLNIREAYIMGHSMGGKTAMYFATMYSDSTLGIISVDMGAHGYWKGNHDEIFNAILLLNLQDYKSRREIDEALSQKISDIPVRLFILKNLNRSDDGYQWKANFRILHDQYQSIRAAVPDSNLYQGPALFIRGANSPYIRDNDMDYIVSIFPKASLETITGSGHWVHAEKPNELLTLVSNFLE